MKVVIAILLIFLSALQVKLWVGEDGIQELRRLERAIMEQEQENERLKERNQALDAEVKDLKEGLEAIEERARNELGMIKKGEVFYQIVEPSAPRRE